MSKVAELWKNLKNWQRGMLVYALISFSYWIYSFLSAESNTNIVLSLIILVITPSLVGAIVGWIIGQVWSKNLSKEMKIFLSLFVIAVSVITIYYLLLFILTTIAISGGYGFA